MKAFKTLVLAATAVFGLAACGKTADLGPAKVTLDGKAELVFDLDATQQQKTFSLEATVDWAVKGDVPSWLALSEESGRASASANTLTLRVMANPDIDRSAELTFAGGAKSAKLTVLQKGEKGSGQDPSDSAPESAVKVSVADFLKKSVNTTDWYELTGSISSITGAAYGNFYLKDETGTVYVYGLVKEWADGGNNQSFGKIGLKEGDEVTIWSLRSEYNGDPQAGGTIPALYKSHKSGTAPTYPAGSVILTFPDENKETNGYDGYDKPWTAKVGINEFNVTAFNNHKWDDGWTYIRCGRKAVASEASIVSKTPVASKTTKLLVTFGKMKASDVNSVSFAGYSDADLKTQVFSVAADGDLKVGECSFSVPADKQAAGLYYELSIDCKTSSESKNGFVEISKLIYVAAE